MTISSEIKIYYTHSKSYKYYHNMIQTWELYYFHEYRQKKYSTLLCKFLLFFHLKTTLYNLFSNNTF